MYKIHHVEIFKQGAASLKSRALQLNAHRPQENQINSINQTWTTHENNFKFYTTTPKFQYARVLSKFFNSSAGGAASQEVARNSWLLIFHFQSSVGEERKFCPSSVVKCLKMATSTTETQNSILSYFNRTGQSKKVGTYCMNMRSNLSTKVDDVDLD